LQTKMLNLLGTLLMVIVIIAAIPFTVPKWFGYQLYHVLTGSMEPSFPVGSVVYVKETDPSEIRPGDVIAYRWDRGEQVVVTHRVIEVKTGEQRLITKGDANNTEDSYPVSYEQVIGKVVLCLPELGKISEFLRSGTGIVSGVVMFVLAFVCWSAADRIKKKQKAQKI
jgi:signal peptidase